MKGRTIFHDKKDILLPKLLRPIVRKIVIVIEKNLLKFEAAGREFSNILRSLTIIYSNSEKLDQF